MTGTGALEARRRSAGRAGQRILICYLHGRRVIMQCTASQYTCPMTGKIQIPGKARRWGHKASVLAGVDVVLYAFGF
jgi:hypothetical protein